MLRRRRGMGGRPRRRNGAWCQTWRVGRRLLCFDSSPQDTINTRTWEQRSGRMSVGVLIWEDDSSLVRSLRTVDPIEMKRWLGGWGEASLIWMALLAERRRLSSLGATP